MRPARRQAERQSARAAYAWDLLHTPSRYSGWYSGRSTAKLGTIPPRARPFRPKSLARRQESAACVLSSAGLPARRKRSAKRVILASLVFAILFDVAAPRAQDASPPLVSLPALFETYARGGYAEVEATL